MADGYLKGSFDRGDLADKYVVMIVVDNLDAAIKAEKLVDEHGEKCSTHKVFSSGYDIDYDQHKVTMSSAFKKITRPTNG